ncbi:MAG: hypothetical protein HQK62_07450 [Desulfamplus sp.]|nr:hypothetical protein [Desulfamplus sp.]
MRNYRHIFICLFSLTILFTPLAQKGYAAWYGSDIDYQQAVSKIVKRGDISWGDKANNYYRFGSVAVSADGSKILFAGKCEFCDKAEVRPFLVNTDGSDIKDLSGMLPSDITSRWSGWRNMIINDDGSKLFFRAVVETGYYDDEYLYVYDVAQNTTKLAVAMDDGFSPFSSAWRFRINENGERLYMDKYDAGWDEALKKRKKGFFYAQTGGAREWYFDIADLPCQSQCSNMNLLNMLGVSAQNDRVFFQWNSDYDKSDGSNQHTGLYYTDLAGNATRITDEHYTIYEGDWRGISDTKGNTVTYRFIHQYDTHRTPQKLAVVDVASKSSKEVAWTNGLNGFDAHLSRSGRYVLVNGEYGDKGAYYQTLLDLESDKSRDTWSYYMMSRWGNTSNITKDDRYYFYSIDETDANSGLYRIDTRTTGDDKAPYVHFIEFSAPALLDQDGVTIAAQVKISDPQGNDNIDRVTLLPLIEGQEKPSWAMGRVPLSFPSGDPGSTRLYDDGTHGDATANDGIYTFDSIATRKGDRDSDGWNTWYQHYELPSDLGIRIVIMDKDNNYTIADSTLRITDNPEDIADNPSNNDDDCAKISDNLDISIPCAVYKSPFTSMFLWLDFEYKGTDDLGFHIWKLGDFGEIKSYESEQARQLNDKESYCSTISDTLSVSVPCAVYTSPFGSMSLWLDFECAGQDMAGDAVWRLKDVEEIK